MLPYVLCYRNLKEKKGSKRLIAHTSTVGTKHVTIDYISIIGIKSSVSTFITSQEISL